MRGDEYLDEAFRKGTDAAGVAIVMVITAGQGFPPVSTHPAPADLRSTQIQQVGTAGDPDLAGGQATRVGQASSSDLEQGRQSSLAPRPPAFDPLPPARPRGRRSAPRTSPAARSTPSHLPEAAAPAFRSPPHGVKRQRPRRHLPRHRRSLCSGAPPVAARWQGGEGGRRRGLGFRPPSRLRRDDAREKGKALKGSFHRKQKNSYVTSGRNPMI